MNLPQHPGYYVTRKGRVFRQLKSGKLRELKTILAHSDRNESYLRVSLYKDGKRTGRYVHHLVLEAFVGPKPTPKHVARHLNDIGDDNRAVNLAWGLPVDNGKDRKKSVEVRKRLEKKELPRLLQRAVKRGFSFKELSILTRLKPRRIEKILSTYLHD